MNSNYNNALDSLKYWDTVRPFRFKPSLLDMLKPPAPRATSTINTLTGTNVKKGDVVYWVGDGMVKTYSGVDISNNNQQQGERNDMNTGKNSKMVCECKVVEEVEEFLHATISPTANGYKVVVVATPNYSSEEYSFESLASALAGLGHAIEEFDQEQDEDEEERG